MESLAMSQILEKLILNNLPAGWAASPEIGAELTIALVGILPDNSERFTSWSLFKTPPQVNPYFCEVSRIGFVLQSNSTRSMEAGTQSDKNQSSLTVQCCC